MCGVGAEVTRFEVGDRVVSQAGHRSAHVTREDDYGPTGNLVKVPDGVGIPKTRSTPFYTG